MKWLKKDLSESESDKNNEAEKPQKHYLGRNESDEDSEEINLVEAKNELYEQEYDGQF